MKYNGKYNQRIAGLLRILALHPLLHQYKVFT